MQTGLDSASMIKQAIRLSDYISRFTDKEIRGEGSKKRTACPIHGGSNMTAFSIDDDFGLWKCNSDCNRGGSIIDFWMALNKNDEYGAAIEALSRELSVKLPEQSSSKPSKRRVMDALADITVAAKDHLFSDDEDANLAYKYLRSRGLSRRMIKKWEIGFIPSGIDAVDFAKQACKDSAALEHGGFLNVRDSGRWVPMNGRILFPVIDQNDDVLGFSARKVEGVNSSGSGKYINTPETTVYHKSNILYGMNRLSDKVKRVYLVEGQMDAIAMNSVLPDGEIALAPCGTAFTQGHFGLIRSVNDVVSLFDGDRAGKTAMMKSMWMMNEFPDKIYGVVLPEDQDPCDIFKQDRDALLDAIDNPQPLLSMLVPVKWELCDGDPRTMRDWLRAEVAQKLKYSSHKDIVVSDTARALGQNPKSFKRDLALPIPIDSKMQSGSSGHALSSAGKIIITALLSVEDPLIREGVLAPLSRWKSDSDARESIEAAVKNWLPFSTEMDISVLKRLARVDGFSANHRVDPVIAEIMPTGDEDKNTDMGNILHASLRQLMNGMSTLDLKEESFMVAQIKNIKKALSVSRSRSHQMMILSYLIQMAIDVEIISSKAVRHREELQAV